MNKKGFDMSNIRGAREMLPQPELMAMAAEECTELAHALLQLRRAMDDVNPTRIGFAEAIRHVMEEWADVKLTMLQLNFIDPLVVMNIMHVKNARWIASLIGRRKEKTAIRKAGGKYNRRMGYPTKE